MGSLRNEGVSERSPPAPKLQASNPVMRDTLQPTYQLVHVWFLNFKFRSRTLSLHIGQVLSLPLSEPVSAESRSYGRPHPPTRTIIIMLCFLPNAPPCQVSKFEMLSRTLNVTNDPFHGRFGRFNA